MSSHSKEIGNKIGLIGISIGAILCILILWLSRIAPPYIETIIRINNPSACIKKGDEWVKIDHFTIDDDFYICGKIITNKPDLQHQIQIRVYENELSAQVNAIYYDNIWISNGDESIPIRTYLLAGNYIVQISSGKKTINTVNFLVLER